VGGGVWGGGCVGVCGDGMVLGGIAELVLC